MKITIKTEINAQLPAVWDAWVTPEDITKWNFAIEDWSCPSARIDLTEGGEFN